LLGALLPITLGLGSLIKLFVLISPIPSTDDVASLEIDSFESSAS